MIRNKDLIYFSRVLSDVFITFKVVKSSWVGKTDPTQKLTKVTSFAGCKPFNKRRWKSLQICSVQENDNVLETN